MSALQNNLKEIFNTGRERSINVLINDIKKKYEAYLASGRDEYTYFCKWTEPGYFMSPFYNEVCDDSHVAPDANYINGIVNEREMCLFMSELTRALEKYNIYASNSSCKYEEIPEIANIHYMRIKLDLSLIKPQKYSQSSDY